MTKKKLIKLLENVPDDYEVLIDTKKLRTVFTDHEKQQVNLSSDTSFQYAFVYNSPLTLEWLAYAFNKNKKQCISLS